MFNNLLITTLLAGISGSTFADAHYNNAVRLPTSVLLGGPLAGQPQAAAEGWLRRHRRRLHSHSGDDDENDDKDKKLDFVSERECEIKLDDGEEVEFECKSKEKTPGLETEDKLEFKVSIDEGLKVEIKYETQSETRETENGSSRDGDDGDEDEDGNDTEDGDGDETGNGDGTENETEDGDGGETEDRRILQQEQEAESSYEVVFDRIVEYQKANPDSDNQAYNWEEDTIVSEYTLNNWNAFTQVKQSTSSDGATLFKWNVTTVDQIATFMFTITQGGVNKNITANNMEIEFLLKDYPWENTNGTYVALLTSVESEKEVEVENESGSGSEDEQEDVSANDNDFDNVRVGFGKNITNSTFVFGEFTWVKDAEVLGQTLNDTNSGSTITTRQGNTNGTDSDNDERVMIRVVATRPKERVSSGSDDGDEQEGRLAFSFVGGEVAQGVSRIYWDPTAGITYDEGDPYMIDDPDGDSSAGGYRLGGIHSSFACVATTVAILFGSALGLDW